jgi:sulfonate transport system ATP-binding protein
MTSSTLVSFRHVRKSWQQVTALQNFSLDIAAGELVVLVGSSGCGKSTLLRMLVGLEPVTQGDPHQRRAGTGVGKERGIVFQEPRLFPWLTVIDNVMLGLADEKLSRGEKRQRALAMLERVQLRNSPMRCHPGFPADGPAGGDCPRSGGPSADPDAR